MRTQARTCTYVSVLLYTKNIYTYKTHEQDASVAKHSLGYVEQVANAMAPSRGCLHSLASAGSVQVFAAAFVLAVNVAKTTDSLDLQVCVAHDNQCWR
jgi:hypothetical protein